MPELEGYIATEAPKHLRAPAVGDRIAETSIFGDDNFGGFAVRTSLDVPRMYGSGYNDAVSSIIVYSGTWEFFEDWDYGGQHITVGTGHYPSVEAVGLSQLGVAGWNDRISSFRPVGY